MRRAHFILIHKRYLFLIFILALSLRLLFLAYRWNSVPVFDVGDEIAYHLLAVNLLKQHIYGNPFTTTYQPEHAISPGYPIFIAMIYLLAGIRVHLVLIAQCIIDSLIGLIIYGIVLRLKGQTQPALIAGMLYALWPAAWYYSQHFFPEPLLGFIFALTFFFLIKPIPWRSLFLGVLSAAALYIKSTSMILPFLSGIVLFLQPFFSKDEKERRNFRKAFLQAGVFILTVIFLIAPWMIRNKLVLGRMIFATLVKANFISGSGTYTLAALQGENLPSVMSPRYEHFFHQLVKIAEDENPGWKFKERTSNYYTLEELDILSRTAWNIVLRHPFTFLKCHLRGFLLIWLPAKNTAWYVMANIKIKDISPIQILHIIFQHKWSALEKRFLVAFFAYMICFLLLTTCAVRGAWKLLHHSPLITIMMIITILYMMILPSIYPGNDRYYLPSMPLLFSMIAFSSKISFVIKKETLTIKEIFTNI